MRHWLPAPPLLWQASTNFAAGKIRMNKKTLTTAERAVLEEIKRQPFITQKELAANLEVARPTVATYIERLQSKGYIHGRAYVLADENSVCCIGGITMDRTLQLKDDGILGTSNPALSFHNRGGVARNVAENLARLSVSCKLLALVGNDEAGTSIVRETSQVGVDTSLVGISQGQNTGSYTAVMSADGELYLGVADLEICEEMDTDFIGRNWSQIAGAQLVFTDTNISSDALRYLLERCHDTGKKLFLDPVSVPKSEKLPSSLNGVDTLVCDVQEARAILGAKHKKTNMAQLSSALLERGPINVVINAAEKGLYLADSSDSQFLDALEAEVVDVSGGGEALVAGIMFGRTLDLSLVECCQLGMLAGNMALASVERCSPALTAQSLLTQSNAEFATELALT